MKNTPSTVRFEGGLFMINCRGAAPRGGQP
jgi:hypothetical protein